MIHSGAARMTDSFATRIARELGSWDGVVAASHRFGGLEFRVGRRELGHLHGSRLADLPFPVAIRNQLVAAGRAERHHILPDSGWVTVRIQSDDDVKVVIELFRLNYERPWLADVRRPE
jgi:Luciferase